MESDKTNDVVTYHMMTKLGEHWVLNDFSKVINIILCGSNAIVFTNIVIISINNRNNVSFVILKWLIRFIINIIIIPLIFLII